MQLSDFKLRSLSFELRFENSYRLWDISGDIWTTVQEKWNDLKMVQVSPNVTKFVADNSVELAIQIDQCSVVWPSAKIDSKVFIEYCEFITNLVKSRLGVRSFKRIGVRQIFLKPFDTPIAAADDFVSSRRLRIPEGKNFGVEGALTAGEYAIRMEGEAMGWFARTLIQNKKISFQGPLGEDDIPHVDVDRTELAFDFDYFTVGVTPVGQLKPKDWIEQALHVVRRDSGVLLEPMR